MNPGIQFIKFDNLSNFIGIFIFFFFLIVFFYSLGYMKQRKGLSLYYLYIFLTLISSLGAVFSNNLILFIVFWGFLGFLLYLLIEFNQTESASYTAKKTFIIIGGTDALMLFGLAIVWYLTGSLQMDEISITLDTKIGILAYICLAVGAFAKAGAMPFHTWIPDTATDAPIPVTAFLPASLDKLLGIYLLARMSLSIFETNVFINTILMMVGSITIVAAVMMALIQHDFKRLLGYHAVSQVGYMVLGIGSGNPIGIAGGLFHMLNHAIYKSCLFLSGGAVEKEAGTADLQKLGGFAKNMPLTFISFLIASLAISGIPPLNGFASKWMIYQGLIETANTGNNLWILWLIAAMFGSALTLASFMKLIHSIFLGQSVNEQNLLKKEKKKAGGILGRYRETDSFMLIPQIVLASLCVIFGVFAYQIPLKMFVFPSLREEVVFHGLWNASFASLLILVGIIIGIIIYLWGTITKTREVDTFIGGEILKEQTDMRISGTEFYNTIRNISPLNTIYKLAEKKAFDIYDIGTFITLGFNKVLRYLHNGILLTYLAWCCLAMIILFYILLR